MAALPNPRHERFCQEMAKGASQAKAYETAGFKPSRSAAARLFADVNIRERLAELAERTASRTELTAASITERLLKVAEIAEKTGIKFDEATGEPTESSSKHLTVLRNALMDAAKINGLVVEKQEHKVTLSHEEALDQLG